MITSSSHISLDLFLEIFNHFDFHQLLFTLRMIAFN